MTATPAALRLSPLRSQAVFRVLLASLAKPGRVFQLPETVAGLQTGPAASQAVGPGIVPLALAVIGSKIAVPGAPDWEARICQATGASPADLTGASLVALYGPTDAAMISLLPRGTSMAPEDGAKVGLGCDTLIARGHGEVTLELSGPGVAGHTRLGVDGVSSDVFDALRGANAAFPAGVDVWLVDERGHIAGLPRSTHQVVV
jgi:alpha-D-ribose 1-methylphosphonate 5-triphosphate synthase subunit PhnH